MLASVEGAQDAFVGRGVELRRLRGWLASTGRLLTLRGPAGVGKSRLAWEFTARTPGAPVLRCDLFGAATGHEHLERIAARLGVEPEAIGAALRGQGPLLLVVDDVVGAVETLAAAAARWLDEAPELRLLVTSREALGIAPEEILDVGPLSPADDAVELLSLRAAAAGADLRGACPGVLRAIARALDGLPLALELAAAQLPHLDVEQLLERLPGRLEILVRKPGSTLFSRFEALRDAIDASWQLLAPRERAALARLSIFRGGFGVEAATAVLDLDRGAVEEALAILQARSLLQVRDATETRWALDESLRIFAERQLGASERIAAERRHTAFFLHAAAGWARALDEQGDLAAAAALEREQENLLEIHRRALHRSSLSGEHVADALHAVLALEPLLFLRHHAGEVLRLLDPILEAASPSRTEPGLRARALLARGKARLLTGRPAGALPDFTEAAALARGVGSTSLEARALLELARLHREQGRDERCRACCLEALALIEALDVDYLRARAYGNLGILARERGEIEEAFVWLERAVAAHIRAGDRRGAAVISGVIGNLLFDQRRFAEARARIGEAIAVFRSLGDSRNEAALVSSLAAILQEQGEFDRACAEYERALLLVRTSGRGRLEATIVRSLASAHHEAGRYDDARRIYGEALAQFRVFGDGRGQGLTLMPLAVLDATEGRFDEAEQEVGSAEQLFREVDDPVHVAAVEAARAAIAGARAARLRSAGQEQLASSQEEAGRRGLGAAIRGGAGASEDGRLVLRLAERALGRAPA